MKKVSEHIPLLSICLLYLGLCNLYFFYKEFKIDIYNYVTSTEIILSFFPGIKLGAIVIYLFAYNLIITLTKKNEVVDNMNDEHLKSSWYLVKMSIFLAIYLIGNLLIVKLFENTFHYKDYELQVYRLVYSILFIPLIYFISGVHKNSKLISENFTLVIIFITLYLGTILETFRTLDASKIKNGISDSRVSFIYDHKAVTSSGSLIYIGQTQNNIFLYSMKDSSSQVYKISNLDSLTIK